MPHPKRRTAPWIAQQFANGVNTWLHINGGYSELFDRRVLAPMREVFARLQRWEPYFDEAQSGAQVAIVFSRHTQDNYGGDEPHALYLDAVRGYYCALQEAHIPFDVISDKFIDDERLRRYRVLVLPNMACIADASAAGDRALHYGRRLDSVHFRYRESHGRWCCSQPTGAGQSSGSYSKGAPRGFEIIVCEDRVG